MPFIKYVIVRIWLILRNLYFQRTSVENCCKILYCIMVRFNGSPFYIPWTKSCKNALGFIKVFYAN